MRALTLWQPWASLVAVGAKKWETRSWSTKYRGPLLIHAAMRKPPEIKNPFVIEEMIQALGVSDFDKLPRGAVLAVVDLVGVRLIEDDKLFHLSEKATMGQILLGDFRRGRYGWLLENFRRLEVPVRINGKRGLWCPPADLALRVMAEVAQ